jgi:hypothetical protein
MRNLICLFALSILMLSCQKSPKQTQEDRIVVTSPDQNIELRAGLDARGRAFYQVTYSNEMVIDTSLLGFDFTNKPRLSDNLEIMSIEHSGFEETWEMPWGEQREVENNYNELRLDLQEQEEPQRRFALVFRLYNDGFGFRYEFPEQEGWTEALIAEERTEFNLTKDYKSFWIPGAARC